MRLTSRNLELVFRAALNLTFRVAEFNDMEIDALLLLECNVVKLEWRLFDVRQRGLRHKFVYPVRLMNGFCQHCEHIIVR